MLNSFWSNCTEEAKAALRTGHTDYVLATTLLLFGLNGIHDNAQVEEYEFRRMFYNEVFGELLVNVWDASADCITRTFGPEQHGSFFIGYSINNRAEARAAWTKRMMEIRRKELVAVINHRIKHD